MRCQNWGNTHHQNIQGDDNQSEFCRDRRFASFFPGHGHHHGYQDNADQARKSRPGIKAEAFQIHSDKCTINHDAEHNCLLTHGRKTEPSPKTIQNTAKYDGSHHSGNRACAVSGKRNGKHRKRYQHCQGTSQTAGHRSWFGKFRRRNDIGRRHPVASLSWV